MVLSAPSESQKSPSRISRRTGSGAGRFSEISPPGRGGRKKADVTPAAARARRAVLREISDMGLVLRPDLVANDLVDHSGGPPARRNRMYGESGPPASGLFR